MAAPGSAAARRRGPRPDRWGVAALGQATCGRAAEDAELQREVAAGLDRAGFGVVEVGRPGLAPNAPDDAPVLPGALRAAVVGHGFGFDALVLGALLRERHPRLGVVYVVCDPWMRARTRALDHRCERAVLRPPHGQWLCMALLARVLGQIAGPADDAPRPTGT